MSGYINADRLRAEFPEPADWTDIEQTVFSIREIWEIIDRLEEENARAAEISR